jgi:hypothetical protein
MTVHQTDEAAARSLLDDGVRIDRTDPNAAWGQGFYSSTLPDRQYGGVSVRVAVRLVRPLVIPNTVQGAELLEELMAKTGATAFRDAVLAAGHDGLVLHFGPGDTWVVAFLDGQVKVVMESRPRG